MNPQRIQLQRTKGWNLQATSLALNGLPAVKVSRPAMFGNPFRIGFGYWGEWPIPRNSKDAVGFFSDALHRTLSGEIICPARVHDKFLRMKNNMEFLRGKNLACFCKLGAPCHADVLLKVANNP